MVHFNVEQSIRGRGQVEPKYADPKHEITCVTSREFQTRGIILELGIGCCEDDFSVGGSDSHTGEQNDEDDDDSDGDESSGCGGVLGLAVVPEKFAVGEEVEHFEEFCETGATGHENGNGNYDDI